MKDWIYEFISVLGYSKRTQLAIILGFLGCFVILVLGAYQLSDFELSGSMSSISDVIKQRLSKYYHIIALGCLLSFLGTALTFYKKDKKRFYR
ncbi:MAG: hypothetical protein COA51_04150 [Idiomarina sp.]|nr:MAG: hypothetical protein COA51_04150 [Idiomarina sp.]